MGIPAAPNGTAPRREAEASATDKRRIVNRLKRVEGQIRGLQRMVDEERPCREVLTLLAGIRSALDATGDAVLASYLERCTAELPDGNAEVAEMLDAIRLARG